MLNLILDAVATFHLTYATAKMSKAVIPREILPIDTAYGGKFKYLTFWCAVSKTHFVIRSSFHFHIGLCTVGTTRNDEAGAFQNLIKLQLILFL